MPSGSVSTIHQVGPYSLTRSVNKTADGLKVWGDAAAPITLPAANAVTGPNFTNNGDNTATAVLSAGHTLVDGKADLYWTAGIRYGCTVDVTGDSVLISGGAGSALPTTGTACTISNQKQINTEIDGDRLEMIAIAATRHAHVDMQHAGDATVRQVELQADDPDGWDSSKAGPNPYTGEPITKTLASNGDSAAAAILTIIALQDTTP